MTELQAFEGYLTSGRGIKVEVDDDRVTIKITSEHEGMVAFDFEKEPSVFDEAMRKMKEIHVNRETNMRKMKGIHINQKTNI